jgi:nicotinamide-nucleotide amidase
MPNTKILLAEISKFCQERSISVAVAESVTAGTLQCTLSHMPGALSVFNGGLTAYNIGVKTKLLGVDYVDGERCNCVSEHIAIVMALNVCLLLNSNLGIGITGYASPVPEENIYEAHAYLAICLAGTVIYTARLDSNLKNADKVQQDFAQQTIMATVKCLSAL